MARVTLGPLLSSISGSVGSACFRRSATGTVLYNRPLPTAKFSPQQLEHRSFIAGAAAAWRSLDPDLKRAWSTLAKSEAIPTYFSRGRRWTGRQLYTCFFIYRSHCGHDGPPPQLPESPLFVHSPFIDASAWMLVDGAPSGVGAFSWVQSFYSLDGAAGIWNPFMAPKPALWAGYLPRDQRRRPRTFRRVTPLVSPSAHAGFDNGARAVVSSLGPPPGVDAMVTGIYPRVFDLCLASIAVTPERILFTGDLYGSNFVQSYIPTAPPWDPSGYDLEHIYYVANPPPVTWFP